MLEPPPPKKKKKKKKNPTPCVRACSPHSTCSNSSMDASSYNCDGCSFIYIILFPYCRCSNLQVIACNREQLLIIIYTLTPPPPFSFQGVFLFSMVKYESIMYEDYKYPVWGEAIGWLVALSSMLCIPIYMIYIVSVTEGSLREVCHYNLIWFDLIYVLH